MRNYYRKGQYLMDFSRQREIFEPESFKLPVHVIGCGATGSWVAVMLAKLGVKDLHLHDFDIIEEHNLPNQLFKQIDIGRSKVSASHDMCSGLSDTKATLHNTEVTGDTQLSGIVFILTDTMFSRADIYKKALKNNVAVPLVIETRMGTEGGRVYAFNPCKRGETVEYAKTLYTDDEAVVSACGIRQTLAPTAALIASLAVWQLIKFHNDVEIDNEIIIDAKYNTYLTRKF